jgi:hypothetical protein
MAMIEPSHIETAGTATIVYSPFGGGQASSGFPTATQAPVWLSRDIKVIEATLASLTPPGTSKTRRVQFSRGGVIQGGNLDLTDGNANVRSVINGTISQPTNPAFGNHEVTYNLTDIGTPAGEVAAIAFLYEDTTVPRMSLYGAGGGATNLGVGATPQFLGFNTQSVASTELSAQHMIPLPSGVVGTFQHIRVRFTNGTDNSYNLEFRKNGVTVATVAIPHVGGTATFATDDAQAVTVQRGDLVCWRLVRTSGADTAIVLYACIGFTAP